MPAFQYSARCARSKWEGPEPRILRFGALQLAVEAKRLGRRLNTPAGPRAAVGSSGQNGGGGPNARFPVFGALCAQRVGRPRTAHFCGSGPWLYGRTFCSHWPV